MVRAMKEWIDIKDQRPPFMEMVIFFDGDNVWPGWDEGNAVSGEDVCYCCADPGFREDATTPTHWMLLPEGPK